MCTKITSDGTLLYEDDFNVYKKLDTGIKILFTKIYNVLKNERVIGIDILFVDYLSKLDKKDIFELVKIDEIGNKGINKLINEVKSVIGIIEEYDSIIDESEIFLLESNFYKYIEKNYPEISIEDILENYDLEDLENLENGFNLVRVSKMFFKRGIGKDFIDSFEDDIIY